MITIFSHNIDEVCIITSCWWTWFFWRLNTIVLSNFVGCLIFTKNIKVSTNFLLWTIMCSNNTSCFIKPQVFYNTWRIFPSNLLCCLIITFYSTYKFTSDFTIFINLDGYCSRVTISWTPYFCSKIFTIINR